MRKGLGAWCIRESLGDGQCRGKVGGIVNILSLHSYK